MNQTLLKGDQIYTSLVESLKSAKYNIVVVTAWFTDDSLLQILNSKVKENLDVSIIIGDNKDNTKLNFKEFESLGGKLTRIKGKGFGIMHQKYCVIDSKTAFHGSYNWTINARMNNSESVIKTDHSNTIKELLEDFKNFKMKTKNLETDIQEHKGSWLDKIIGRFIPKNGAEANPEKMNGQKSEDVSIDEIFKSIISAEIKKTNRGEIKEMAYNQAKEVSGDSQVITKFMDSLYHLFISDKSQQDINKEKLLKKIDDKVSEVSQGINAEKDKKIDSAEIEMQSQQKEIERQKNDREGRIAIKENEKKHITDNSIQQKENEIMEILRKESAELAAEKSYSSILINQSIYRGGRDITQELAAEIDGNYK